MVRKHSRAAIAVSTAAAWTAFGVLGVVSASASTDPWAQVVGALPRFVQAEAAATHPQQSAVSPAVAGIRSRAGEPSQQVSAARLDSRAVRAAITAPTAPAAPAAPIVALRHAGTAKGVAAASVTAGHAAASAAKRQAARHSGTRHHGTRHHGTRHHGTRHRHAAKPKVHAGPTKPYLIYDSVSPGAIPGGRRAAVYVNGAYFAPAAAVASRRHVLWIDTNGSDPHANVLDVEPGDATPYGAGQWVKARLSMHPHRVAIVYTMRSEWQAVKDNVATLPAWMRTKVRYWIADPTGVNHIVPGASATQWYWGKSYDITSARPNFER